MTPNYLGVSRTALLDTGFDWPTTAIFSGIHGDEVSGIHATKAFYEAVVAEKITIANWRVILVFEGNELAVGLSRRYAEKNLNRLFRKDTPDNGQYEPRRALQLMGILDTADFLLDLHSTSGPSVPFLFSERNNLAFARSFGISRIIVGWNDLGSDSTAGDTENYLNARGGRGFTFEAGNHHDVGAAENASRTLLNFLVATGQLAAEYFVPESAEAECILMTGVRVCHSDSFEFRLGNLENFTQVRQGVLIAMDGEEPIYAEHDFILVMPNLTKVKRGEDAFFYGMKFE